MENFAQDPLLTDISSSTGTDSSHENHPLESTVEGCCRWFSLNEIQIATNKFDDALIVGTGGFGCTVYKGFMINNGTTTTKVAIKRLKAHSSQGAEEFWAEVKFLSNNHHPHLVSLIGYCRENQEMILVYEYMAHGTLASHLYRSSREEWGRSRSQLNWTQRLNVCLGAARGLNHLHTGTEEHIIHRDVKTTNILLNENWVAKVSDVGIGKLITSETTSHVSTKIKATRGYWDPDYMKTGRVTRKADVYSFGVVLLEVLCGRPPLNDRLGNEQSSLVEWAKKHIKNRKLDEIIDPSLKGETTPQSLNCFAKLAYDCLHVERKERPTMSKVVEILQSALDLHRRKGISWETVTNAFLGLKLVPEGLDRWWREVNGSNLNDRGGLPKQSFSQTIFDDIVCPRFSLYEIISATNSFHEGLLISQDHWSTLYKGCVARGHPVATIKRFKSRQDFKKSGAEIQVHTLTRHPNTASLIGFCMEKDELILVYDYMVNGTLKSQLENAENILHWKKRLEICIDAARGLDFLHTNADKQFIHRAIKSSNILLDDKWVAKVASFELSGPIPTNMAAVKTDFNVGTLGYVAPEHLRSGRVTQKIDVFAFGALLLEVLCANYLVTDTISFLSLFLGCIGKGDIDQVIDPYLLGKIAPECFRHYVNIALSCMVEEDIRRPSMDYVLHGLQSSLQMQEAWENSVEMSDELHKVDIPKSYNDVISVESKFTFGGQSYLISDLVHLWRMSSLERSSSPE